MEKVKYRRIPKESYGIEVTKKELNELLDKGYKISISNVDEYLINEAKDNEFVGSIMGDIDDILNNKTDELSDLWFVNKTYLENNLERV